MTTAETPRQILHADQEHSGLRTVVFLSLFVALGSVFLLLRNLLPDLLPVNLDDYAPFLSCVLAIPVALAIVWGVELLLKRFWHSGLSLVIDDTGLYIENDQTRRSTLQAETAIEAGQPAFRWAEVIRFTNWYFGLSGYTRGGRERRVSPNWYCLASELQQDDNRLIVFTFMPPQRAAPFTQEKAGSFTFHPITPTELQTGGMRGRLGPPSRPSIPNQLLHSKDGRYWLAERRRWEQGVELTAEDFVTLLTHARNHQPTTLEDSDPHS